MGQLEFKLPQKGGRRKGAGRKPKGPRALVSHKVRTRFETPAAVLVTLRVATHAWNLRSRRCFRVIEEALASARGLASASLNSRSSGTTCICS